MATKQTQVRELQEGNYVMIDDKPCKIDSYSTAKPGKHGSAKARIECTGVFDGQKRSISQPVDASIRVPVIQRKEGQIVNVDDDEIQIMDLEGYDTFKVKVDVDDGDSINYSPDDKIEFLELESRRKLLD